MIIYATVQYLRSSWLINYHASSAHAAHCARQDENILPCQPIETWRITLHSDTVSGTDLCAMMLWGKNHPSTLQPGRIIKSVERL